MKIILFMLLAALCMLLLTGCGSYNESGSTAVNESAPQTQDFSTYTYDNSDLAEITTTQSNVLPTFEEVQAEYPDKTVLVWAAQYLRTVPLKEINKYLDDNGYGFAVCFKPFNVDITESALFPDACADDQSKTHW